MPKNNDFESRIIVLKKCDLPKQKSILSMNSVSENDDAYCANSFVSFQNYHYIDILAATPPGGLPEAYQAIQHQRTHMQHQANSSVYRPPYSPEFHTVQTMTLMGRKSSFWDEPTDILYITFIQQLDSSRWSYCDIENALGEAFTALADSFGDRPSWCLYYSLDFCDLVLFTKGINLKCLNDLLWNMSICHNSQFLLLQDTFTICAFGRQYLENAFNKIDSGEKVEWNEELAVSCKLGIQNLASLHAVKKAIDSSGVQWHQHRLTGRYDLLIEAFHISGDDVIRFLYDLDKLTIGDRNTTLANFEVTLMTPLKEYPSSPLNEDYPSDNFSNCLNKKLTQLYRGFCKINNTRINYIADYVYETQHSLLELVRNGFAEEFVLSILPSLDAYLEMANTYEKICSNKAGMQTTFVEDQVERFTELTIKFFSAVNTLAACTMHNERQFVQAPSFNAAYFEIPPKLLVFYNRVAQKIVDVLATENDDQYQFLIIPDYRPNINVEPFKNPLCRNRPAKNIAIIYLWEKYFYDPAKAIMLLAHEVGHYIGNRYREERAVAIFNAIGCVLFRIYYAELCPIKQRVRKASNIAGEAFGKFLLDTFLKLHPNSEVESRFYFEDVKNHVFDIAKCLPTENMKHWETEIITIISEALQKAVVEDPSLECTYSCILKGVDEKSKTTFFSSGTVFKQDYRFGCNMVAREMLEELLSSFQMSANMDPADKLHKSFLMICTSVTQIFSEAFADLQLLRICGNNFSASSYVELLTEVTTTTDRSIRYRAMRAMVSLLYPGKANDFDKYDSLFKYSSDYCNIVEKWVVEYLMHCHADVKPLKYIDPFFKQEPNLYEQARKISMFIANYKDSFFL